MQSAGRLTLHFAQGVRHASTTATPLKVAIAGLGTVGAGVAKILHKNADLIAARSGGRSIQVVGVADPKVKQVEDVPSSQLGQHHEDCLAMLSSCSPDVLVEAIGGTGIALQLQKQAAGSGISIVTANKALLAKHGKELTKLLEAQESKGKIAFEAAVGGGIPCIKALKEGLAANNVTQVSGIMNGTCNFILSTMETLQKSGKTASFQAVLADAQSKGYAETPPDLDVDGWDTAHKLSILTAIAFKGFPNLDAVHVEGIRKIHELDIGGAAKLGYRIKLLGIAEMVTDIRTGKKGVLQRVHPACIPSSTALASVSGVLNALCYQGDFVGPVMTVGRGAGQDATASAVVADLIDMACGRSSPTFGLPSSLLKPFPTTTIDSLDGMCYFVRAPAAARMTNTLPIAHSATLGESICLVTKPMSEEKFKKEYLKLVESGQNLESFNWIRVHNCAI
eukprot:gb/GEZN01006967.1/.p1 GENE.gb/GEZN01006967.1/~~gb/GEZN01006967.1/.p1  ORF type:complete len:459 (+),score=76.19 gb/GEZN01006967.1/:26-1378(+)